MSVGSLTHFIRAVLAAAIVGGHALVAIGVVDRREHNDKVFEQGMIPLQRQLAREHKQRFLAADFAGMDVAEGEDNRLT